MEQTNDQSNTPAVESSATANTAAAPTSTMMNLADPGKRILAAIIDFFIILIPLLVVLIPLAIVLGVFDEINNSSSTSVSFTGGIDILYLLISGVIYVIARLILYVYIPAKVYVGQTIGKKALGLRIVKADGSNVDFGTMTMRNVVVLAVNALSWGPCLGSLSSCAYLIVTIVNFIMLFADEKKQTVYDKIADTVVVDAK